jgi:hypothetical protein
MEPVFWIDYFSISFLFVFTLLLVVGSILLGQLLGSYMRKRTGGGESIGSVVGATLGFLAFLLAFTFNMAANRYDNRKSLMVEELNSIHTAYRRAGLLDDKSTAHYRTLLKEYMEIRVLLTRDMRQVDKMIHRSEQILDEIWKDLESKTSGQNLAMSTNLFSQSISEMMRILEKRIIVGLHFRIPGAIWMGLYVLAVLAMMVVGFQFGQSKNHQWLVSVLLAVAFSFIIVLIADLDRSTEGTIVLDQTPVIEFQKKIEALD